MSGKVYILYTVLARMLVDVEVIVMNSWYRLQTVDEIAVVTSVCTRYSN